MNYKEEVELRQRLVDLIVSYDLQTINDVIMIYHDLYSVMYDPEVVREVLGVNELWQLKW